MDAINGIKTISQSTFAILVESTILSFEMMVVGGNPHNFFLFQRFR